MKAQSSKQITKNRTTIPQGNGIQERPSAGTPASKPQPVFDDVHARIAKRAYELYVERGCREGGAEQDWLDAEREILNRTFPE